MAIATGKELDAILSQMTSGNPYYCGVLEEETDATGTKLQGVEVWNFPKRFAEVRRYDVGAEIDRILSGRKK